MSKRNPQKNTKSNSQKTSSGGLYWMYGIHAVREALHNPLRKKQRLLVTEEALVKLEYFEKPDFNTKITDRKEIDSVLPKEAVHQGVALQVAPLPSPHIEDIAMSGDLVIILDQVTDPHNIGAILRSAAAFGAQAVVVQDKYSPKENGVMAKSASGGAEHVPLVSVTNLSRAIEKLQEHNFWVAAFDSEAEQSLEDDSLKVEKRALVFGAEGQGVRPLVLQKCDLLLRLPTQPPIASLNVSNAVAIGLYAAVAY